MQHRQKHPLIQWWRKRRRAEEIVAEALQRDEAEAEAARARLLTMARVRPKP